MKCGDDVIVLMYGKFPLDIYSFKLKLDERGNMKHMQRDEKCT
jgi:hypothetical protein